MPSQLGSNKTLLTALSVNDFIAGVEHPVRRQDAQVLLDFLAISRATPPSCGVRALWDLVAMNTTIKVGVVASIL